MEEKQVNIATMSVVELKALAYDQVSVVQNAQQSLGVINKELGRRAEQSAKVGEPEAPEAPEAPKPA